MIASGVMTGRVRSGTGGRPARASGASLARGRGSSNRPRIAGTGGGAARWQEAPDAQRAYDGRSGCSRPDRWWPRRWTGPPGRYSVGRLVPRHGDDRWSWVRGRLPGPVAVTYEAGPTGFGLARALSRGGHPLRGGGAVEAGTPARGSGQDRPARRPPMARLLHIGEIDESCAVRVPSAAAGGRPGSGPGPGGDPGGPDAGPAPAVQTAAAARDRLLRWEAWTGDHDSGCASNGSTTPALGPAFDEAFDAVLTVTARRDRLDGAIDR